MTARAGSVRVYLPASLNDLSTLTTTGSLRPRAPGQAVTAALRAAEPDGDIDEWEFLAFLAAAQASLGLLEAEGSPRRVVVSADIDPSQVREVAHAGAGDVQLGGDVEFSEVAAVHVDGPEAEPTVSAVLSGAHPDSLDDVALEWYSPSEVADLLA
jgi:hypothetical protein